MKKILIYIIIFQLYNCKYNKADLKTNSKNELEQIIKQTTLDDIRYVTAKSGLNYRKKPHGQIIGKFEFGEKIKIVEHTNIFENIYEEKKLIKGEWLGVKSVNKLETKYIFDGFTATKKEFDIIGNDITNLIPSGYEIEYQAKGDLNNDGIDDIATVIKKKNGFNGDREVMIFLKNDNFFKINKISKTVFPNKFFSKEMDTYYQESISISNNELLIELFGTGPVGNNFSKFKYFQNKLLLTNIETYYMGAGSHSSLNYDLLSGQLIEEVTNTMKENMPTKRQIFNIDKKEYYFENCNPENIIIEAYNKINDSKYID